VTMQSAKRTEEEATKSSPVGDDAVREAD
jgi:hypothetical protein